MNKSTQKNPNAKEMLEILSCQWLGNQEIASLLGVGTNKAIEIRRDIEKSIKDKYGNEIRLPSYKVPTEEVVSYFNININYLKKMASILNK